jgi:hypothetical protein
MELRQRHRGHRIAGGEQGGTGISNTKAVDQRGQSAARQAQPATRRGRRSEAESQREPVVAADPAEAVAERAATGG